jgi:hypothetical protein
MQIGKIPKGDLAAGSAESIQMRSESSLHSASDVKNGWLEVI